MSENKKSMELDIDEQTAQGKYSNIAIIAHSNTEFIIDFGAILPGMTTARVSSRVITTPMHAKRFLQLLHDNIAQYEKSYGKIEGPSPQSQQQAPQEEELSFATKMGDA